MSTYQPTDEELIAIGRTAFPHAIHASTAHDIGERVFDAVLALLGKAREGDDELSFTVRDRVQQASGYVLTSKDVAAIIALVRQHDAAHATLPERLMAGALAGQADVDAETFAAFLKRVSNGGSIVSTDSLSPTEIAIARAEDRLLVTASGLGYVHIHPTSGRLLSASPVIRPAAAPLPSTAPSSAEPLFADQHGAGRAETTAPPEDNDELLAAMVSAWRDEPDPDLIDDEDVEQMAKVLAVVRDWGVSTEDGEAAGQLPSGQMASAQSDHDPASCPSCYERRRREETPPLFADRAAVVEEMAHTRRTVFGFRDEWSSWTKEEWVRGMSEALAVAERHFTVRLEREQSRAIKAETVCQSVSHDLERARAQRDSAIRERDEARAEVERLRKWAAAWKRAAAKHWRLAHSATRERETVLLHYEDDQKRIVSLERQLSDKELARDEAQATVEAARERISELEAQLAAAPKLPAVGSRWRRKGSSDCGTVESWSVDWRPDRTHILQSPPLERFTEAWGPVPPVPADPRVEAVARLMTGCAWDDLQPGYQAKLRQRASDYLAAADAAAKETK